MGAVWRRLETVLAAVVPRGEALVLCDYGAVRGETAGLGAAELFERARHPRDHVVIGLTERSVVVVPVLGALRPLRRCSDRAVEILARDGVIIEVAAGAADQLGGVRAVPVRFVRRDGSACLLELHGDPAHWFSLSR